MDLTVAPESYSALKTDGTIRCILDVKYTPASRRSSVAFALANDLVKEFTDALLVYIAQMEARGRGQNPVATGARVYNNPTADVKLNMVTLRGTRIFICYDMFLEDYCGADVRAEVDQSVERPIHVVCQIVGNEYDLRRSVGSDEEVAKQYAYLRKVDRGPRPYFTDSDTVMYYEDGERLEDPDPEETLLVDYYSRRVGDGEGEGSEGGTWDSDLDLDSDSDLDTSDAE